ncbi:unnamed protein product [Eruca vesicaria subsp. sativa]|uniref:Uncharacterized protein n=1 Tax=Eruca vesicaria subsp. sativa TaxID=29727 RepID=A0ABC8M1D7_ERUVS|nr:unnamed protein product [Eruca vesicaria subsp. sativa]
MALPPHVYSLTVKQLLGKKRHTTGNLPRDGADQAGSSSKVVHAQKIEPLTIKELNDFVLTGDPQSPAFKQDRGARQLAERIAALSETICLQKRGNKFFPPLSEQNT